MTGDAAGYFEELQMDVEDESAARDAPRGRAVRHRDIAVSQDIQGNETYTAWRESALERGYRSLAVVPLEYGDELYGLLVTFASRPDAFDQTEQDLLVELGDDIAYALHNQYLQAEIEQANAELNTVMRQVPIGLILMSHDDGTFRYRRFNHRMEELSGLSSAEIRGKTPQEALGPEDGAAVTDRYRKCVEQKATIEYTSEFEVGGEVVVRRGIVSPVTDDGGVEQLIVVVQDITEERRRQERLERTTSRLEAVFDNSPDMISVHDSDGRLIDSNSKLRAATGYEADELTGMTVWELDQAMEQGDSAARWNGMDVGDVRRFETEYQRKDGSAFPVEVHLRRLKLTGEGQFVAISRDITDQKRAERKRRQIIDRMNDAIVEVDPDWRITLVNGQTEDFAGRTESELLGQDFWAVFSNARGTRFEEASQRAMDTREETSIVEYYSGVGEWFDIHIYPNDDGGLAFYFRTVTEYKQRQRELQRVERRYQAIFEDPNILAGILDTDGTLLEQNRTAMEYIDADLGDVVGKPFWETPWWPEELQPKIREKVERAATGEYVTYQADLTRPDGDAYTVSGVIRPVSDDSGHVVSLVVSAREITEQKKRERQLQAFNESMQELLTAETPREIAGATVESAREILGLTANAIHLYDDEVNGLVPVAMTDAIQELVGDPPTFEQGNSIAWRVYERGEPEVIDDIRADPDVYNPETGMRSELYLPLGEHGILLAGSPESEAFDEQIKTAGEILAANVTAVLDQVVREQELQTEQQFTESLFDALPDPMYAFDTDGSLIRWNDHVETVTGYTSAELTETDITDLVPPDDANRIATNFQRILEERRPMAVESAFQTADGRQIPYEFTGGPLEDADGELRGVTGVGRDLTEQNQRRGELKRQNDRLEEFSSVVSHDLRSPLRTAEGRLELAQEECDSPHLADASDAIERSQALITDLLTLARGGDTVGSTEPVSLSTLAAECWEMVPAEASTLTVEASQAVAADRGRLEQLLQNLFANAVEHGGGGVTVRVGDLSNGFYVEDDGTGIPAGERADIFDAGYSTTPDGTGFGLRIVKRIADAHGWEIRVTDSADGGARFEITGVDAVE